MSSNVTTSPCGDVPSLLADLRAAWLAPAALCGLLAWVAASRRPRRCWPSRELEACAGLVVLAVYSTTCRQVYTCAWYSPVIRWICEAHGCDLSSMPCKKAAVTHAYAVTRYAVFYSLLVALACKKVLCAILPAAAAAGSVGAAPAASTSAEVPRPPKAARAAAAPLRLRLHAGRPQPSHGGGGSGFGEIRARNIGSISHSFVFNSDPDGGYVAPRSDAEAVLRGDLGAAHG
jgi:hypothetical protein